MRKLGKVLCLLICFCVLVYMGNVLFEVKRTGTGNGGATLWNREVQVFADALCSDSRTDKDKVMAIYGWITSNISYDDAAKEGLQFFNAEKVLESKQGVCFDIANLFAAMCRSQGIPCYVVDGYSRKDRSSRHSWNRVFFEECWYNADITYDTAINATGKTPYGFVSIGLDYDMPDEDYVITRLY